jgi:hypothetical protein
VVAYAPLGKYAIPRVLRKNLSGLITAPPILMWNVDKN